MVGVPGGTAAPAPVCRPNVYGRLVVQVIVKLPLVPFATPPWNEVYAKSTAVIAERLQTEVSVTLTLKVPVAVCAYASGTPITPPQSTTAATSFFVGVVFFVVIEIATVVVGNFLTW